MTTDDIRDQLATAVHSQRWVTHDWARLRSALDSLPTDEMLRMGKDELRDSINRVLLEMDAVDAGVSSALAVGVL